MVCSLEDERSSAQGYCSLSPLGDHTTSGHKEQTLSSTGQRAGKAQAHVEARGGIRGDLDKAG